MFRGKYLCWNLFFNKLYLKKTPTQVFFCEYCKIFKNNFFYRTPLAAASAPGVIQMQICDLEIMLSVVNKSNMTIMSFQLKGNVNI